MKLKEQTKPIEDKCNESKATKLLLLYLMILLTKEKKIMSELYDSVDYNNVKFEYIGSTKDVSFHEYMDSKELFNAIKNNQIKFSEVKSKEDNFLKKLNEVKIGKKTDEQKEVIDSLNKFLIFK